LEQLWVYHEGMARGWESKSVEAQMEDNRSEPAEGRQSNSPEPALVEEKQKKANLLLARRRVVQQLEISGSEKYSEMLRLSLADLDEQIAAD
jgi:hypothetical protein